MVLSSAICVIQTQHLGSYLTDYCGTGEVTAPNFWLTIQRSFERMNWGSGGWDGGTKRHIIWCLRLRNCWRATTLCSRRIMSKGGKWSTHRCLRLTQTPQIYSTLTQIISWSIPCSGCSLHSHCSPKLSQFLLWHANVPESLAYRQINAQILLKTSKQQLHFRETTSLRDVRLHYVFPALHLPSGILKESWHRHKSRTALDAGDILRSLNINDSTHVVLNMDNSFTKPPPQPQQYWQPQQATEALFCLKY